MVDVRIVAPNDVGGNGTEGVLRGYFSGNISQVEHGKETILVSRQGAEAANSSSSIS